MGRPRRKAAIASPDHACDRLDQNADNQTEELRRYVKARGWEATDFIEQGVSGAKDKHPKLTASVRSWMEQQCQPDGYDVE